MDENYAKRSGTRYNKALYKSDFFSMPRTTLGQLSWKGIANTLENSPFFPLINVCFVQILLFVRHNGRQDQEIYFGEKRGN